MRRTFVLGPRQHLRHEHREHHLARRLGVRAAPGLGAHGDQEDGAEIERHAEMIARRGARNPAARLGSR
jgi:hypothetical protein